jgi:hypothetical protein
MIFCLALQDFTAGEIFPPTLTLPLGEGSREKIQIEKAIACLVVQGAEKIYLPKSAGHSLGKMGSPDFRPGTWANSS